MFRICHRDIKPENVLVKVRQLPQGNALLLKLSDFGLSRDMRTVASGPLTREVSSTYSRQFHAHAFLGYYNGLSQPRAFTGWQVLVFKEKLTSL